jgi:hypothetical protein
MTEVGQPLPASGSQHAAQIDDAIPFSLPGILSPSACVARLRLGIEHGRVVATILEVDSRRCQMLFWIETN